MLRRVLQLAGKWGGKAMKKTEKGETNAVRVGGNMRTYCRRGRKKRVLYLSCD